jgi:hypothetical protein
MVSQSTARELRPGDAVLFVLQIRADKGNKALTQVDYRFHLNGAALLDVRSPLSIRKDHARVHQGFDRFHAFCRCWSVTQRACASYRVRTKGKVERGVGYVEGNAIAGHRAPYSALSKHPWHFRCSFS